MNLEELQIQKAEIFNLLQGFIELHRKALTEEESSLHLDKCRKDILICFNDLCTLNNMMITHDGEVREMIKLLKESRQYLSSLIKSEKKLVEKISSWENDKIDITSFENVNNSDPTAIEVPSTYRGYLNQYISLVGANNTTLSSATPTSSSEKDELIDKDDLNNEIIVSGLNDSSSNAQSHQLLSSITLLNKAQENAQSDIASLQQLLANYQKDYAFIKKELRIQSSKIRNKTDQLYKKVEKIYRKKVQILESIGFTIPQEHSNSLTQKLVNFTTGSSSISNLSLEDMTQLNTHSIEFIDVKLEYFQSQLVENKENAKMYVDNRDSWLQCIEYVTALENDLRRKLREADLQDSERISKIISTISITIEDLHILLRQNTDKLIQKLIIEEKSTLQRACEVLSNEELQFSTSSPLKLSSSESKRNSSPPFLLVNKSQTIAGLSDQNIFSSKINDAFELDSFKSAEKNTKND
ncbi:hypothetical protein TBLA_0G02120 [Henningerozyma blattae CBS 6284]|uniref:Autophagy-related protein 23 n=1 Tax=Henningerozyma blattae (strain ATCC 34711 / CBS 6284 / DSM 70876 / NBRC 10599 / NRRL Y-10934 / UCD 77-7) TaxID=1071380 RepID=I2H701_HENB6|nr:hypothetical protein TBLA_0G02120 [Tetrapisispora blattae CBS 6284]CCH62153.1 hypothetical protein TBLA_0G02120 [Tetrapisispora blattae CBS 6284]